MKLGAAIFCPKQVEPHLLLTNCNKILWKQHSVLLISAFVIVCVAVDYSMLQYQTSLAQAHSTLYLI